MGFDDRRAEVIQAAWRVTAREGLDRTSMRAIAQELGSSTGVVTHYFRNKDELILAALEQVFEGTIEAMKACAETFQGRERLEQMLFLALPLEGGDRDDWKVWLAFLGYSVGRERLLEAHRQRYGILQDLMAQVLVELQGAGVVKAGLEIPVEANALIALVDGISMGIVINPAQFSQEQQRALVRRHLDGLLSDA